MNFRNKTIIVTGGAQGIGLATAIAFARQGGQVYILDNNREALDPTGSGATHQRITYMACDVTDEKAVNESITAVTATQPRIDILINNAGINPAPAAIGATSPDDWQHIIDTNLTSLYLVTRSVLPQMAKGGAVVNIASILGIVGARNCSAYAATKAAIIALTKSLALDYAPDLRVNCICPGPVDTKMFADYLSRCPEPEQERRRITAAIPLQRLGTPDDIAKSVLFMASEENAWLTGAILVVDGGDSI